MDFNDNLGDLNVRGPTNHNQPGTIYVDDSGMPGEEMDGGDMVAGDYLMDAIKDTNLVYFIAINVNQTAKHVKYYDAKKRLNGEEGGEDDKRPR